MNILVTLIHYCGSYGRNDWINMKITKGILAHKFFAYNRRGFFKREDFIIIDDINMGRVRRKARLVVSKDNYVENGVIRLGIITY